MTQDKIIKLIQQVSRCARNEDDFNNYMIPTLNWLVPRSETPDTKSSLEISNILITIVFSFYNFLGGSDFAGHSRIINKMDGTGIFAKSLDILKYCGEINNANKMSSQNSDLGEGTGD